MKRTKPNYAKGSIRVSLFVGAVMTSLVLATCAPAVTTSPPSPAAATPLGSPDPTFGVNGIVTTDFDDGSNDLGNDIALQPDGKIILAGQSYNGSNNDFTLILYNGDGSPDASFGANGKAITGFRHSDEFCYAVALQPDGKIVMAGRSSNGSDFAVDGDLLYLTAGDAGLLMVHVEK